MLEQFWKLGPTNYVYSCFFTQNPSYICQYAVSITIIHLLITSVNDVYNTKEYIYDRNN